MRAAGHGAYSQARIHIINPSASTLCSCRATTPRKPAGIGCNRATRNISWNMPEGSPGPWPRSRFSMPGTGYTISHSHWMSNIIDCGQSMVCCLYILVPVSAAGPKMFPSITSKIQHQRPIESRNGNQP